MPRRHKLPLGFGERIPAVQWRVEASGQGQAPPPAQEGPRGGGRGGGEEHATRRIHRAGRKELGWPAWTGVREPWSALGRGGRRET